MAVLSGVLVDANGDLAVRATVSAVLVDPGTGRRVTGQLSDATVVRKHQTKTDESGAWELDLTPNGDLDWPLGTGWAIELDDRPAIIVSKASGAESMDTVTILDDSALPATPAAVVGEVARQVGELGPGDIGADPAGTAASEAAARVAKAGDTMTGDLVFDKTSIRELYGSLIEHTYTQTVAPTDLLTGAPIRVKWHATIGDSGTLGGPTWNKGDGDSFGLSGIMDIAGRVYIARNMHSYACIGPAFSWALRLGNNPGAARTISPTWGYQAAPIYVGDGAKMTVVSNDTNAGGAMFVDCQIWTTANTGEVDGETNDAVVVGLMSTPAIVGNSHMAGRVVVDAYDVVSDRGDRSGSIPVPDAAEFVEDYLGGLIGPPALVPGQDAVSGGIIDWQSAIKVRRLVGATVNVGIENASATVNVSQAAPIVGPSSVIDDPGAANISATLLTLDNSSGGAVTLTSTPTIPAGVDGQILHVRNGSAHAVTVQGDGVLAGSGVRTIAASRTIGAGEVSTWIYSDALSVWAEADIGSAVPRRRPGYNALATVAAGIVAHPRYVIDGADIPVGATVTYEADVMVNNPTGSPIASTSVQVYMAADGLESAFPALKSVDVACPAGQGYAARIVWTTTRTAAGMIMSAGTMNTSTPAAFLAGAVVSRPSSETISVGPPVAFDLDTRDLSIGVTVLGAGMTCTAQRARCRIDT